jgi:hypothetical protein
MLVAGEPGVPLPDALNCSRRLALRVSLASTGP